MCHVAGLILSLEKPLDAQAITESVLVDVLKYSKTV